MIDTVKLTIHCPILRDEKGYEIRPYNQMLYDILLKNVKQNTRGYIQNSVTGHYQRSADNLFNGRSTIYTKHDNEYESMILNGQVLCPSHNYHMHFRVYEERIDLEFSIPKFIYGTNVLQLLSHYGRVAMPYEMLVLGLKKVFQDVFFGVPVHWGAIELRRWDFCFNQCFETKKQSLKALHYIKLKHQSKGDRLNYEFGLIQLTKSNYLKIYHKGEEFEKHDRIKYEGMYLKQFQEISDTILRYEKKLTPRNVAYQFNMNFRYNDHPDKKEYLKQKNSGRVEPYLLKEFETVRRFFLGKPIFKKDCYQITPKFFNFLWVSFKTDIEKKFSVGKMSVDSLRKQVVEGGKGSSKKIKILTYIKTFGSLKRAYESGAFTKATYYRYKSDLEKDNLSETKVPIKIEQDWSNSYYHRKLFSKGISVANITKSMSF